MDNQQRVNHRRRRHNLPAELKVEIVFCLPMENAVHFLANVPNRLIIHHCAPRVRRMLKMIDQIASDYARTLSVGNCHGRIWLQNGHKYMPEMDIFLRYGAAHCRSFGIFRGTSAAGGFFGYPANFFDDLIKYFCQTKTPGKAVRHLDIELPLENPAPWPVALVQPQVGEMKIDEEIHNEWKFVRYILRNQRNPGIAFKLHIFFERRDKCYQQVTDFVMFRVDNVQSP